MGFKNTNTTMDKNVQKVAQGLKVALHTLSNGNIDYCQWI